MGVGGVGGGGGQVELKKQRDSDSREKDNAEKVIGVEKRGRGEGQVNLPDTNNTLLPRTSSSLPVLLPVTMAKTDQSYSIHRVKGTTNRGE